MASCLSGFFIFFSVSLIFYPSDAKYHCQKLYMASPLERKWLENIGDWQGDDQEWAKGCKAWENDKLKFDKWMSSLKKYNGNASDLDEDIFSYHVVSCANYAPHKMYLEPLAVALRTPNFPCGGGDRFDTAWLAFPHASSIRHRRAYFFDVGSTYYDAGVAGYADSLAWFLNTYRSHGITFDRIYAWEVKVVDHKDYWKRVPAHMVTKVHFFNTAASEDPQSPMNPLSVIAKVAAPKDYVVLKLDIDTTPVEVAIILQLLNSPHLMDIVDELFWENHVNGSPTQWHGWRNLSYLKGPYTSLKSSYELFSKLRHAGIRAHSWV